MTKFAGTNTPAGGMIAEAERRRIDLLPTLYAEAHPSAPASACVFEALVDELVSRVRACHPVDGVVLSLHGAMVAEGYQDCDGHILGAIRTAVGPQTPVVVELDIHANVSGAMVEHADALIGRRTYPEVDMFARGEDCVRVAVAMIDGNVRPQTAWRPLPFVWGINQATGIPPMVGAIKQLEAILCSPGVITAAISTGYPYADAFCTGASVRVTVDGDRALADRHATALARWITERRHLWFSELSTTADAIVEARRQGSFPAVFADRFDNTGAGTPGDSTGMLQSFVAADLEDACILYIVDRVSAEACHAVGPGAKVHLDIGGRSGPDQGPPVSLLVTVEAISDGEFSYGGEMYRGVTSSMGPSALVRHRGVQIVLVSVREQPYDTAFAHTLGLFPEQLRFIGVKSQAHFRAGFEGWAGAVYVVREPSIHNPRNGSLSYRRVRPEIQTHLLEA